MINDNIYKRIDHSFSSNLPNEFLNLMPCYPPIPTKRRKISVGMNPSFSLKGHNQLRKEAQKRNNTDFDIEDIQEFFSWENRELNREQSIRMDKFARQYHPFFAPTLQEEGWEHIDLSMYRMTSQKTFTSLYIHEKKLDRVKLTKFGESQFEIAWELIEYAEPQLILVANALASKIIQNKRSLKWDEELGFHWIEINNTTMPIFFSSMLTGQRALDKGSVERLFWHIRQAEKYMKTEHGFQTS